MALWIATFAFAPSLLRAPPMRTRPIVLCDAAEIAETVTPADAADDLLRLFAGRYSTKTEKLVQLDALQAMDVDERAAILDAALDEIDDISENRWAMRRWPLRLPSRRLSLGCVARLVQRLEASEMGGAATEEEEKGRRRRRLVAVLRQGVDARGAYKLEGEVRRREARSTTMEEMLKRTPDLETPKYDVVAENQGWEVREYADFAVAGASAARAVDTSGPKMGAPSMPKAGAFQSLAGYIFGSNSANEKMAMTTPVFTAGTGEKKELQFVMPSRYWASGDADKVPSPRRESGVTLRLKEGGGLLAETKTVAVVWFGGYAGADEVARRESELLERVRESEWQAVDADAKPYLLQYNDPFTAPWARRNEVAIPVKRA